MKHESGFTLIELMIVIAILGIILAFAIPQYKQYVIRGNRAAAQSFMMNVASREKQYLLDARSYISNISATAPAPNLGMAIPTEVASKYTITVCVDSAGIDCTVPSTPPYFLITATPIAGTPQAADGSLTLDDVGTKMPAAKW